MRPYREGVLGTPRALTTDCSRSVSPKNSIPIRMLPSCRAAVFLTRPSRRMFAAMPSIGVSTAMERPTSSDDGMESTTIPSPSCEMSTTLQFRCDLEESSGNSHHPIQPAAWRTARRDSMPRRSSSMAVSGRQPERRCHYPIASLATVKDKTLSHSRDARHGEPRRSSDTNAEEGTTRQQHSHLQVLLPRKSPQKDPFSAQKPVSPWSTDLRAPRSRR